MEKIKYKKELLWKLVLFTIGLFVISYGTAITTRSNIGTTPIACPPYVMTFFLPLTFGMTTFFVNVFFLVCQIFVLKKSFPKIQLVQILIAFLLGIFLDLSMAWSTFIHCTTYTSKILAAVIGSLVVGLGIAIEVYANLTYLPGDGLVKVIDDTTKFEYGKIKIAFDISLVLISIILGLVFINRLEGIGVGTLISAFLVGFSIDIFLKIFGKFKKV